MKPKSDIMDRICKRANINPDAIKIESELVIRIEKCQQRISKLTWRIDKNKRHYPNLINDLGTKVGKKYAQLQRRKKRNYDFMHYLLDLTNENKPLTNAIGDVKLGLYS